MVTVSINNHMVAWVGRAPQGSVLGARLYYMFMYVFSNIIKQHGRNYHSHADDMYLYILYNVEKYIHGSISRLQNCINET